MNALLDAREQPLQVLREAPDDTRLWVLNGAADFTVFCAAAKLRAALVALLACAGNEGTLRDRLSLSVRDQFVCFSVPGAKPSAALAAAAGLLGAEVVYGKGEIALLVPSADWSPSHKRR